MSMAFSLLTVVTHNMAAVVDVRSAAAVPIWLLAANELP